MLTGCTGRHTQSGSTPQPAEKPQTQQGQEPGTPQTTGEQQGEPQTTSETNEDVIGTQSNGDETNSDVVDPNAGVTPTTTTPTTTPPSTSNPTGTVNIQGSSIQFQDLKLTIPAGWKLHQDAINNGTMIIAFEKGDAYFRLYARAGAAAPMQGIFVNGSQVVKPERDESIAGRSWKRIETRKDSVSVAGFMTTFNGHTYFGFGRSGSAEAASAAATEFLSSIK